MKIIVCSDSHGNNQALDEIKKRFPDVDYYLHAGDSESASYDILPFDSVKGNCDRWIDFDEKRLIETPFGRLLIQHFPDIDINKLKKNNIKVFIHGHTHKRRYEMISDIYFINPGAIAYARDGNDLSYVLLTINNDNIEVKFYSLLDKQ